MMKIIMGFLGSYSDGFEPSKIPAWAGALAVLAAVVAVIIVVVNTLVTVVVAVAILNSVRLAASSAQRRS